MPFIGVWILLLSLSLCRRFKPSKISARHGLSQRRTCDLLFLPTYDINIHFKDALNILHSSRDTYWQFIVSVLWQGCLGTVIPWCYDLSPSGSPQSPTPRICCLRLLPYSPICAKRESPIVMQVEFIVVRADTSVVSNWLKPPHWSWGVVLVSDETRQQAQEQEPSMPRECQRNSL